MLSFIKNKMMIKSDGDFTSLANILMNNSAISINGTIFRICEIEFYTADDIYTDNNIDQKQYGKWYFRKRGIYFKEGTARGVEITLGDGTRAFGILIRSIRNITNNTFIEGPCRVVNTILELCGYSGKRLYQFAAKELLSVTDNDKKFIIINYQFAAEKIINGKRDGLRYKKEDTDGKWFNSNYRYGIFTHLNKKKYYQ